MLLHDVIKSYKQIHIFTIIVPKQHGGYKAPFLRDFSRLSLNDQSVVTKVLFRQIYKKCM